MARAPRRGKCVHSSASRRFNCPKAVFGAIMSRVEEHEKRRLALPFIQQLSREVVRNCSCLGTLDRDCRYHIDRFLAADALQARLRVFEIEGDWDDILRGDYGDGVPGRLTRPFMSTTLFVLNRILLMDYYMNDRPRDTGPWWVSSRDYGEPHYYGKPERQGAREAEGWSEAPGTERKPNGLRLSDALDLADPWKEGNRRYGADRIRRNRFRSLQHCHEWWAGLLSSLVLHVMQDAGSYGPRPVHVPLRAWPWVETKPKLPPSLELTEQQQVKIASWPHRVRYISLPYRKRLAPETRAWFEEEIARLGRRRELY